MAADSDSRSSDFGIFVERILRPEKVFYQASMVYGAAISLLTLAVPVSVQMLINSVAYTALPQSLLTLVTVLSAILALYAVMNALQAYVMELFERRFFARTSEEIAQVMARLPASKAEAAERTEMIDRFFEIVAVQKGVPSLIVGGFTLFLQTLVGLIVVSFYHPLFLVFNSLFLLSCWVGWRLWHRGALRGAIEVSGRKYAMAGWLEKLAQGNASGWAPAMQRSGELTREYLTARGRFFRYTFAQTAAFLFIYVLSSVSVLGMGGWLVMNGQLTLGQLVAAELILSAVFAGLSKVGYHLTTYYELCAAALKLDGLLRLPHDEFAAATSPALVGVPRPLRTAMRMIAGSLALAAAALILLPWVQTAPGFGSITALRPEGQLQSIHAMVKGRIKEWHVRDGSLVRQGDPILEVVDNDPLLLDRLQAERDAAEKGMEAARTAAQTSLIDYRRKQELHGMGLSARREFEQAKIEYTEWVAKEAEAAAKLAATETKLSRQRTQLIRAPRDGLIVRTSAGDAATLVKEGDIVATFAPQDAERAVELYVNGLDMPLIEPGREVRLQFEGWPMVQFSGWPSVAIGTFAGVVRVVDPAVSPNGKFRILVTEPPDQPWPGANYLRFGAKAHGWVMLSTVSLGYELWRQMNSFPPDNSIAPPEKSGT